MTNISPLISVNDNLIQISKSSSMEDANLNKKWSKDEKRIWIISLFFGAMMLYAVRTVMSLCVLEISKENKYDKTKMATLLSSFFYGYPLTQIPGGYFSDKIGGDIMIAVTAVCWGVLTFLLPFATYLTSDSNSILLIIVVLRCITGGFQGFHYPGTSSLVSKKISETERAFTFSFITSGQHLGTLFCGIVGSIILEKFGWQATFHLIGILSLVWVWFFYRYVVKIYKKRIHSLSNKNDFNTDVVISSATAPVSSSVGVPWLELLSKPAFWSLICAHVCQNNAYYILLTWLPTYFQENFPGSRGWIFNVVPWLISVPSTIFAGWFSDFLISRRKSVTFVRKLTAGISLCGTGFFLFIIAYIENYSTALFVMACTVACCGFHNAGIMVNPQDLAPKHAGSVFGFMNTVGALPGFIGVSFAGYILESTKSWPLVFKQTSAFCFFGYAVYFVFGTGKKIIT